MIFKKFFILSLSFFYTLWAFGQDKKIYNIDSIPVKSLISIGGYQQKKIFINGKNKSKKFDNLFWKNRDTKYDLSKITVVNKHTRQYLSVGTFLYDGSNWNDVFTVGYVSPKEALSKDFFTNDSFKTELGIKLGMNHKEVMKRMFIEPSINTSKDSIIMLRYYFYDYHDYRYEFYKMPTYMIAFRFINDTLVKFGFGRYYGFFDSDFDLDGFKYFDESKEFIRQNYIQDSVFLPYR